MLAQTLASALITTLLFGRAISGHALFFVVGSFLALGSLGLVAATTYSILVLNGLVVFPPTNPPTTPEPEPKRHWWDFILGGPPPRKG